MIVLKSSISAIQKICNMACPAFACQTHPHKSQKHFPATLNPKPDREIKRVYPLNTRIDKE